VERTVSALRGSRVERRDRPVDGLTDNNPLTGRCVNSLIRRGTKLGKVSHPCRYCLHRAAPQSIVRFSLLLRMYISTYGIRHRIGGTQPGISRTREINPQGSAVGVGQQASVALFDR
jgi:hypothetical protein